VVVFFDLETGGLQPYKHPIVQIAAAAVQLDTLAIVEQFERKVKFDTLACTPEALAVNHYTPEAWADAQPLVAVLNEFADLCRRYAWIRKVSKSGNDYTVAQLAAYNASFDLEFIQVACRQHHVFLPASYSGLCTMQRAMWWFLEHPHGPQPSSYKLVDVAAVLGVSEFAAHDAQGDNRAQIEVYRRTQDPRVQNGGPCA
jgi:DNA polymerase III epsilon subunit-like protein